MFVIIGLLVVIGSIVGGFSIAGGNIMALFHLSEIIVILGTAAGTVLVSTSPGVLIAMFGKLARMFGGSPFTRGLYLDALRMLFELFQVARRDGLVALEAHIEGPHESAVFKKYPVVLKHHHAITFLCDSLRVVLVGSVPPHDLEAMMEAEIDVHHEAESMPVAALQRVSDALPGIGIVAAVLGIVITMGAIAGPIEQIGAHVAAALTGTFLGVLCAYGFVGPLASGMEGANAAEARFYQFLKASVVAFAKGFTPIIAVEFARRSIFSADRPTFAEMEAAVKPPKAKPAAQAEAA